MTPNELVPVGVILPDGTVDTEAVSLIPDDVELVPVPPLVALVRLKDAILNVEYGPHIGKRPIEWPETSEATYDEFFALDAEACDLTGDLYARDRYVAMRLAGQSRGMASVLATRSFPGIKTDAIFNEGKFSGDAGRVGPEEQWLRAQAEAAGVSTNGKWYCRGLADFPGDPTAWVGDRGDVLRIAEAKNMKVHGYVEHDAREVDPGDDVTIADDIIESEVRDVLDSHPGARAEDVREQVYALRSGAVDPNPLRVEDTHELASA